jgi:hypothetical protein
MSREADVIAQGTPPTGYLRVSEDPVESVGPSMVITVCFV